MKNLSKAAAQVAESFGQDKVMAEAAVKSYPETAMKRSPFFGADNLKDVEITDDDTLYGQIKGLGERVANVTGLDELADDFGDLWDRIVGR